MTNTMTRLKKLFKKPPTLAQVDAESVALAEKRAAAQQRLREIDDALMDAYGSDEDTEALHEEADRLNRDLHTYARVSAELEALRIPAAAREIVNMKRADYQDMAAHIERIVKLSPEIQRLRRELYALTNESNERRASVSHLRNPYRMNERLKALGLDQAAVMALAESDLAALNKEYAAVVNRNIGETVQDVINLSETIPSLVAPNSGLKEKQS